MRALALGALAALLAPAAVQADPLDVLSAYAGTWRLAVDNLAEAARPASHESHTLKNDCWRSGLYYACTQTVDGRQLALLVFTWNDATKSYTSYPIAPGGEAPSRGKMMIEGGDWMFPWDDGGTHYRVVNHWIGRDRIEFRQEHSVDGQTWTVTTRGVETRQ